MTEGFDADELNERGRRLPVSYKGARWRQNMSIRLLQRARLIAAWFRLTVWPKYGWRALLSMILITCGRLADAASFVAGIHILTSSMSSTGFVPGGLQGGLVWAAFGIAGIVTLASIFSFFGHKLAIKLATEYETRCLVQGVGNVRRYRREGIRLPPHEVSNITRQAPRVMSRNLLQIIDACTSLVLTISGLSVCLILFPILTGLVLLMLITLSPLYIFAALHSTNVGHSMRLSAPASAASLKIMQKKWLTQRKFNRAKAIDEVSSDFDYVAYRSAYRGRLMLSSWNHLLTNMTLAMVVALSFVWIANEVDLTVTSIATIVSYIIALRLFGHGLTGIFNGIQAINAGLPFYFLYLSRDPRFSDQKYGIQSSDLEPTQTA